MPTGRQLIKQKKLNLMVSRRTPTRAYTWYIGKQQPDAVYYLAEFDDDASTAMWCKQRSDAMPFKTEAGVHQFISTYLNNRSDITLVQVSM